MNLDDPRERETAAAEYVLGTLRADERRAFVRALGEEGALRAMVASWETRLGGLALLVPDEPPPPALWRRIERDLLVVHDPHRTTAEERVRAVARSMQRRLRRWRLATGVAAAAAASLAAFVAFEQLLAPQPVPLIAVLQPSEPTPAWLIRADPATGAATVLPVSEPEVAPDRVFELWAAYPDGSHVSLGLLEPGRTNVLELSPEARDLLGPETPIGVSVEPPGGSPTGEPTGPVVFTGALAGPEGP